MLGAQIVGAVLIVSAIAWDWFQFTTTAGPARSYGCGVARINDYIGVSHFPLDQRFFNQEGVCELPHGVARLYRDDLLITLRPRIHRFSPRFRTAWPMKATLYLHTSEKGLQVQGTKRIPWSSALLTLAWFVTVAIGTIGFLITFLLDGGFASLSGALLGLGVLALGAFVLGFGLVIVALGYRIENQRLTQAYEELHQLLANVNH